MLGLRITYAIALSFNYCVTIFIRPIGFDVGTTAMFTHQLQGLLVLGV